MSSLSKEQLILSRETIQNDFFFSRIMSLFDLDILSSIKHPTAIVGTCKRCSCSYIYINDNNFELDENGRKVSKQWQRRNFSFFHSVFERLVLYTCKKPGLVWERAMMKICMNHALWRRGFIHL